MMDYKVESVEYYCIESFILFTILFSESQGKTGGGLFPPENNQNRNQFVCLSFGGRPL